MFRQFPIRWICLWYFLFSAASSMAQLNFVVVETINIKGNKKTKRNTILRELTIIPGDTIALSALPTTLAVNQQQIINTGLFILATMNVKDWDQSTGQATIDISLQENWYFYPSPIFELADRNFNVWWVEQKRSFRRVNYGLRVDHINLTGRSDRLKALLQFGFTRKYELAYLLPALDRHRNWGLTGEVFYAENKDIGYKAVDNILLFDRFEDQVLLKRFRVGGGVLHRKGIFKYHLAQFRFYRNTIGDHVIENLNEQYFLGDQTRQRFFQLSYQYRFDNRDIKPYPLNGHLFSVTLNKEGLGIFNDRNNLFLTTVYAKYFSLNKKFSLETITKGRLALLRSPQPYNSYQALGYLEDFIRGYEFYVIDGLDFGYLKTTLRYEILNRHINWGSLMFVPHFKVMPLKVYLSMHNDVGIVNDPQTGAINSLGNALLWGGGLGLDFVIYNDKVIQFQYSINHLGENGLFLHYQFNF